MENRMIKQGDISETETWLFNKSFREIRNTIMNLFSTIMILIIELGMVGYFAIMMFKFLVHEWNK